jgi:hypothetical protein
VVNCTLACKFRSFGDEFEQVFTSVYGPNSNVKCHHCGGVGGFDQLVGFALVHWEQF